MFNTYSLCIYTQRYCAQNFGKSINYITKCITIKCILLSELISFSGNVRLLIYAACWNVLFSSSVCPISLFLLKKVHQHVNRGSWRIFNFRSLCLSAFYSVSFVISRSHAMLRYSQGAFTSRILNSYENVSRRRSTFLW